MDFEDLVYNAGKKGRDQNGKSRKEARKEAVVNAAVAANLKSILHGNDHSVLTRSHDPALQKVGKALNLRAKNPEVARSATASVNLMDDYTGVSPTDIANFRSANPLLGDFAVEVLESLAFDDSKRASSSSLSSSQRGGKKGSSKAETKKDKIKDKSGHSIDLDGNLVSNPYSNSNLPHFRRRKSFDELNYLYRAQIVKSQQRRPETKQQRLKAEINRKRLARDNVQDGKLITESTDDGAGAVTSKMKNKARKGASTLEKLAEERRKWRVVESAQDKKRREKQVYDSLIRMFEVQARIQEEQKQKKRSTKKGDERSIFSMFRRRSVRKDPTASVPSLVQPNQIATEGKDELREGADAEKSPKKGGLFYALPRLF